MKRPRTRTWFVVLGMSCLALAVALVLVRSPVPVPAVSEEGGIPEEWFPLPDPTRIASEETVSIEDKPDDVPVERKQDVLPPGYVQAGRLVYELDGKRVAEETYRLERRGLGGVELISSGTFSVRVLFVTVSVTFTQEISLNRELEPRSYRLETRGPLGFGNQKISATVDGGRVIATTGDERQAVELSPENAFFVGTFAAYVILPALHASRAEEETLALEVIGGAGGPGTRPRASSTEERNIALTRQGSVEVEVGGRPLVLDQYRVQSGSFGGTLLARGLEFVAFLGEGERVLTVYRSDLYPRGIGPFLGRAR